MKKYFNLIIAFALVTMLTSCEEEYKAPQSATVDMAGRWWTELYFDSEQDGIPLPDNLIYHYEDFGGYGLTTTNTAANDADSVLIDDLHESWPFRVKAGVNLSALTFNSGSNSLNIHPDYLGTGETITIIEGKILKGAARSKSGRVADSLFIEFEFSDDPGSYYIYAGHRDSGQPDDEY